MKTMTPISMFMMMISLALLPSSCTKEGTAKTHLAEANAKTQAAEVANLNEKPIAIQTYTVQNELFQEKGVYLGNIEPIEKITLVAHAGGRVNELNTRPSAKVEKGASLCDIEADKSALQLKSAELSFKLAKDDVDRMQQHVKAGSVSRTQLEQAQKNLIMSEVALLQAKDNMDGASCKSPISGVVLNTYISKFDLLSPKNPTISIGRLDKVKVKVLVPENNIRGYEQGNEALIEEEGTGKKPISAIVSNVAKEIDPQTRSFAVEVIVDNPGNLLPGQTVRIHLIKKNLTNQIVIPQQALVKQADGQVVMVVENGIAKAKKVEVGGFNETSVLITSGLTNGDLVIIRGQHLTKEGTTVIETK